MKNIFFNRGMFLPGSGGPPGDPGMDGPELNKVAAALLAAALVSLATAHAEPKGEGDFLSAPPTLRETTGTLSTASASKSPTYASLRSPAEVATSYFLVPENAAPSQELQGLLHRLGSLSDAALRREVQSLLRADASEPVYLFLDARMKLDAMQNPTEAMQRVNLGLVHRSRMLDAESIAAWGDRLMTWADSSARAQALGLADR